MSLSRLPAIPRPARLVFRRFLATRKKGPSEADHAGRSKHWVSDAQRASNANEKQAGEQTGDASSPDQQDPPGQIHDPPETQAGQDTGAEFTGHKSSPGELHDLPEADTWPGQDERQCVTRQREKGAFEPKPEGAAFKTPLGQTREYGAPGTVPGGDLRAPGERESTVVYHPGDEELVNWGRIKPPGEPPDDMDEREAEREAHKWRRITQAALFAIYVLAIYDFSHLDEEFHHDECPVPKPRYPYQKIRHKEFPWGPCDLLDLECWKLLKKQKAEGGPGALEV